MKSLIVLTQIIKTSEERSLLTTNYRVIFIFTIIILILLICYSKLTLMATEL